MRHFNIKLFMILFCSLEFYNIKKLFIKDKGFLDSHEN